MDFQDLRQQLGGMDIYLLDQIVKGRYAKNEVILDAGCGSGRNLHWFYGNGYDVWAVDRDGFVVGQIKRSYTRLHSRVLQAQLQALPFEDHKFDHVICSAVLHFANNGEHFRKMFSELVRVLKNDGSIFIRMASDMGLQDKIVARGGGRYGLPDGSDRFLLTKELLRGAMEAHKLKFLEPLKTTHVNDLRCMATLVLQKL
ncbi:class I SAM-dependent methyltransferase [Flavobacteriaceae bacterium F89]|uniref:Class I SAM-dependent methyltransferase n=1 Tax=Cerina litoralis TaxID=2874477 RepID=A0AAE3JS31_9FLAO|nr:class I SAM-dependent methyltransferase [Cerina litoralis]MCG2461998.1 class I SAM-dependent methyltransferase [Cerina litoralis]